MLMMACNLIYYGLHYKNLLVAMASNYFCKKRCFGFRNKDEIFGNWIYQLHWKSWKNRLFKQLFYLMIWELNFTIFKKKSLQNWHWMLRDVLLLFFWESNSYKGIQFGNFFYGRVQNWFWKLRCTFVVEYSHVVDKQELECVKRAFWAVDKYRTWLCMLQTSSTFRSTDHLQNI